LARKNPRQRPSFHQQGTQYQRPVKKIQQHRSDVVMPVGFPAGADATAPDSSLALAAPIEANGNANAATSSAVFNLLMFVSPHDGGN
jgi:hypothetical protein